MNDIKDIINRLCDLERRMAKIEAQPVEQAEKQEPVAWMFQHDETGRMSYVSNDGMNSPEYFLSMNPRYGFVCALYTAPPKREWVGLTDEEIAQAVGSPIDEVYLADFRKVIAKLKERNT